MDTSELNASELLLDLGVSVPIRPLRFLGNKVKVRRITIRRPYMGTIIAMLRQYNKIGCSSEELKEYSKEQWNGFIAEHGKEASMIVAYAICRGFISHKIFSGIVAWWLRWRVHPDVLGEVMLFVIANINTAPFQTTIRSVQMMNLMKPRLSH